MKSLAKCVLKHLVDDDEHSFILLPVLVEYMRVSDDGCLQKSVCSQISGATSSTVAKIPALCGAKKSCTVDEYSLCFALVSVSLQLLVEDTRVSDEACLQKCVDIFELHLEKNAERQVNVSGEQRTRVRAEVEQLQKDRR